MPSFNLLLFARTTEIPRSTTNWVVDIYMNCSIHVWKSPSFLPLLCGLGAVFTSTVGVDSNKRFVAYHKPDDVWIRGHGVGATETSDWEFEGAERQTGCTLFHVLHRVKQIMDEPRNKRCGIVMIGEDGTLRDKFIDALKV